MTNYQLQFLGLCSEGLEELENFTAISSVDERAVVSSGQVFGHRF
jgi:hypothetical protein